MKFRRGLLPFTLIGATISILLFMGSVSGKNVVAQKSPQNNATYKIGVVDVDGVFKSYQRQIFEYAELQKEVQDRQSQLDEHRLKFEAAKKQYNENKSNMTEDARFNLEEQISNDIGKYENDFKRLQGDIDRKEKRILESLFRDINTAISEIGASENYHLVFERGEKRNTGLLYSSPTLNLTHRVVEYLNQSYDKRNKSN